MNSIEKNFWDTLKHWVLDDIDVCLDHNANVGATKLIFSAIEVFGSFYVGRGYKNNENLVRAKAGSGKQVEKAGSKKAFKAFVKSYLPEFNKVIFNINGKRIKAADLLYTHFRCGLIHEGVMKVGTGIVKENWRDLFVPAPKGFLTFLNIHAMRDYLRTAVNSFDKDLSDLNQPERLRRWGDRYKFLLGAK